MQDGQFSIPDVTIGQIDTGRAPKTGQLPSSPEYKPISYTPYIPALVPGQGGIQTDPDLYEDIKIANQSGFTNWWNTFINSWNDTQIGVGASDLMDGLKKKATVQGQLSQLEADHSMGKTGSELDYLQKKNSLIDQLSEAYNDIGDARSSMYQDEADKNPISKAFKYKTDLSNMQGSKASLLDQFKYQVPTALGSSLSLMVPSIMGAFGEKAIQTAVTRGIAGSALGSEFPVVGNIAGFVVGAGATVAANLFSRNLESKAEVGSQFIQDYDALKAQYLADRPRGYQLTEDEDNKIILQAAKGADTQYNKNMSLALSDTLQSLIFAGAFTKSLSKFGNLNKFTRLGVLGAEFYANKKLEGLEEGLQYAWSSEKSLKSNGYEDKRPFFDSLLQDYKDVISSMQFFGMRGGGPYSNDDQFNSSVDAGELLGGLFGVTHTASSVAKDVHGYYDVNKELAALNPTKVDDPVFKFKDDLYAQFFGPKKVGKLGVLDQDSEDRVFYFKEALKTLSNQRTEKGEPLLSKEELSQELDNIDQAYDHFSSINKTLDNILSPYGKEVSRKTDINKKAFRDELFHNTMSLARLEGTVRETDNQVTQKLAPLNDVTQIQSRIDILNERSQNTTGNVNKYQKQELKTLQGLLKSVNETYEALNEKPPKSEPIDQSTTEALQHYYDASETQFDYLQKRKDLSKVNSWKALDTWSKGYSKVAPESFLKEQEESIIADNKEFANAQGVRQPVSTLTTEDKKVRKKVNEEILDRAGFSKSYTDTLSEDDLDNEANKALEDFKAGVNKITEDTILSAIYNSSTKDELLAILSRPSARAAFNATGFSIDSDIATLRQAAFDRLTEIGEERRKNKVRQERPLGLAVNGRKILITSRTKNKEDQRNTADYESQFDIKKTDNGRVASQKDVLEAVAVSHYATSAEKELARKLLGVTTEDQTIQFKENWRPKSRGDQVILDSEGQPVGDVGKYERRSGSYNSQTDEIIVDLGHFGDEIKGNQFESLAPSFEATVLHELVHRYTVRALNSDETLKTEFQSLLDQAKQKADNNYYGLSNINEFVAEAMSSPDFQRFLASVEGSGNKTLWQQFIDAVGQLLKRAFGVEIEGSLLEDVIALTSGIIDNKKSNKINTVAAVESFKNEANTAFSNIKPDSKDAVDVLYKTYSDLLDTANKLVNDNNLGEAVRTDLTNHLNKLGTALEKAIEDTRANAKTFYFQGKQFEKGKYVAISGYSEPYWIVGASSLTLEVKNQEGTKTIYVENADTVEFQGTQAQAQHFIESKTKPEKDYSEHGELYKSVQQEFEKKDGQYIESNDPIVAKFQGFIRFSIGQNLAKLPYRGLIVQDNDQMAGFAIPRSEATKAFFSTGGKEGQVVVVVDRDGNPVKFDENFNQSANGQYVVFNIETPKRVLSRDTKAVADSRGVSLEQANKLKETAAIKLGAARKSASEGKPVFVDFTGVNPGVASTKAADEAEFKTITSEDAQRVIRLVKYLATLDKSLKQTRQTTKDFIFDYIKPKTTETGTKVSGGQIFINSELVTDPTEQQIVDNFSYKKVYDNLNKNSPYEVLDVTDDSLSVVASYPTYTEYLATVSELGSSITRNRYNGYLTYEIKEVREEKPSAEPIKEAVKPDTIKPEPGMFEEGSLFDSAINDQDNPAPVVYTNDLGLFDNTTTYDLVKSFDKGIHNYIRKTALLSIISAGEDTDFRQKAIEETRRNIVAVLGKLRETRKNQIESGLISTAWGNAQITSIDDKIDKLENQKEKIVNYYINNSYVFAFKAGTHYMYDENGNLVQAGDDRVAREKGFDVIGNEISPIDGASKETKALIRGLSKLKSKGIYITNSFGVPDLVNFASTWNNLLKNLQGVSTFEEMLQRLDGLQDRFPEYTELVEMLRQYYAKAQGGDFESRIMVAKFYRDFGNPEVPVIQNLMSLNQDGTLFKVEEATRKNVKDLRKQASDNFQHKSKYAVTNVLGNKILSPTIVNLATVTKEQRVEFLEGLGFEFTPETLADKQFDVVASQQIIKYIKEEIQAIQASGRQITNPIVDLSRQTAINRGQTKRINDILDLESKYSQTAPTLSMQNAEDNTEYAISRPNGYSTVITGINNVQKYPTFQDLVKDAQFSYLDKPYARTALILNTVFVLDSKTNYGKRREARGKPITITLTNISGLTIEEGEGRKTTSMFIGDKIVSDINQLLKGGFKELTRAADKNSAFGIKLSTWIQPQGFGILPITDFNQFKDRSGYGGPQFQSIMQNYLKGEIIRLILAHQGKLDNIDKLADNKDSAIYNFSLFAGLLSEDVKKSILEAVKALPEQEINSDELYYQADILAKDYIARAGVMGGIRNFLYNEVVKKKESLEKYGFRFEDPYWLDKTLHGFDAGTLLRAYIVNEFILHIEQTKLFNGDVVFFSHKDGDFTKRTPSNGATGILPITDNWFVDAMNKDPKTNLQAKKLGLNNQYSNVLKTTVFRESVPKSVYISAWETQLKDLGVSNSEIDRILKEYKKGSKEADAQGWITMDYYRSYKISIGDWRVEQDRVYEKVSNGEALSSREVEELGRLFPPIKAQYAGPVAFDSYHVPAFHKFSLLPLIPSAIKGTALESLNERMIRNNVSYALMESGSKLGTIGRNLEGFYANQKSRTMKNAAEPFTNENQVYAHFLKEQVQFEPEVHQEVIFGTQFRKLLFQNVYSSGKAVNEKFARLEQEYSDVINEITEYEKGRLIDEMGVEPSIKDGKVVNYVVKDQSKLLGRIKKEIDRRKLNNSIKEFFELENDNLKYPLDASINHQQVRTLVMSMINNRLIRQTISGDMLVQGSGLGFEKLNKPTDADVLKYGTNGLRFYHVEGGKVRKMQVKTSLTGDFKNLLNYNWQGSRIGTLDRLNKALKDEAWVEENSKSMTMVGYRIPTQGLNSIEIMEVAEFLPPETGSVLIVPSEIVTKAGSDFDIDKLNVFKPSLNEQGYINRSKPTKTKAQIKDSIDPELQRLRESRKTYEFFTALPDSRKAEFLRGLEKELGIDKAEELGQLGLTIQSLLQQIQDAQDSIDTLNAEIKASFDPDAYTELVGKRADLLDLKIYLADELDRKEQLKKNILGEKVQPEGMALAEELLDSLYSNLLGQDSKYNSDINARIDTLVKARAEQLAEVSNYKHGLFNRIIELASERLTDPASFTELITPNSTDIIEPKTKEIAAKVGADKKSYKHTNNLTSSTQEEKFLAGIPNKNALGISAVANTMSQLFNKTGVNLNQFFNKRPVYHPMVGSLDFSDKFLKNGMLKSEIESQMINAYVDVLNNDFISKANLSIDTAGTFFYLLHLGHDPLQLMDFFNNPVIIKYVEEIQKNKSIIKQKQDLNKGKEQNLARQQKGQDPIEDLEQFLSNKARRDAFMNTVQLGPAYAGTSLNDIRIAGRDIVRQQPGIFGAEHLTESVGKKLEDIDKFERLAILSYYLDVMNESSELLKLQQTNNYDTATSVNPVANEVRELIKRELQDKNLFNTTDVTTPTVIKPFNQFALIGNVLDALMPITLNAEVRKQIVDVISDIKGVDPDRVSRVFINDWLQFLAFNLGKIEGESVGSYGQKLLLGTNPLNVSTRLLEFKLNTKWTGLRSTFPVINSLKADVSGTVGNVNLYREDNSTEYQNSIIEQFQKLINFNDGTYSEEDIQKVRSFFKDLMVLGFTQSGLNKSPISFSDLIPNESYAPMMTQALKAFTELKKQDQDKLLYEFIPKFRNINTNLMGVKSNTVPYWRYKNYYMATPILDSAISAEPIPYNIPNGTYNGLIANLFMDGKIEKLCR